MYTDAWPLMGSVQTYCLNHPDHSRVRMKCLNKQSYLVQSLNSWLQFVHLSKDKGTNINHFSNEHIFTNDNQCVFSQFDFISNYKLWLFIERISWRLIAVSTDCGQETMVFSIQCETEVSSVIVEVKNIAPPLFWIVCSKRPLF